MPTGKLNNSFPFLDILGYLKNTHKNSKFGKVRQVPTTEFPSSLVRTCLTLPNLGFLWVFFKYPKISKNENLLFFPVASSIETRRNLHNKGVPKQSPSVLNMALVRSIFGTQFSQRQGQITQNNNKKCLPRTFKCGFEGSPSP